MSGDMSIYSVALEWLRVPAHVLPAVIAVLCVAGLVFLRSSLLANVKTKQDAIREASSRIDQIEEGLDTAIRELDSSSPDLVWEPHDERRGAVVNPKGAIHTETDARCRRLIDDLDQICDAHLPEFRRRVLQIEEKVRNFAQRRREVLSARDAIFRLESELVALSARELEAIAENHSAHGWGDSFDDPLEEPMRKRTRAADEARDLIDQAKQEHALIKNAVGELRIMLNRE